MANLTYVKCDACGRVVEGSSGKCPECGAALVPARTRIRPEQDRQPPIRSPDWESMLPGVGPEPDPSPEWQPEWGPQLEPGQHPVRDPEPAEKKDGGGNVVWTFVSGAFSLGIGVWGVLSGDGFPVWSLLLIGVGASAIISGLRKIGKRPGG